MRIIADLLNEKEESTVSTSFQSDLEYSGLPGRPKTCITLEQLSYLSDYGFKAVDMAGMFHIKLIVTKARAPKSRVSRSTSDFI